ncbi:hypothetical protein [Novosphingobium ovatum]|nr:hypothetical protein [Novosphingobium ovatum]
MLRGCKPLAYFIDGKDWFPDIMLRYFRLFDRAVAAGQMRRHDHFSQADGVGAQVYHHVLFALPGEEWRIQPMLDLMLADTPWTAVQERRQGELLGYADWMNDYWLEHIYVQ